MKRRYAALTAIAGAVAMSAAVLAGPWMIDPPPAGEQLSPKDLTRDLDFLHGLISKGVPTYGVYRDRRALDDAFQAARARLDRPMTPSEFWRILTPVVVGIGDGHLSLSPNPNTFAAPPHNLILPLSVRFVGGRLVVRRNLSAADIPLGSEIISINSLTTEQLIEACSPYVSRLPLIQTRTFEKIARQLSDHCGLAAGLKAPYRISFHTPRGGRSAAATAPATAILRGITSSDYSNLYNNRYPDEPEPQPVDLTFRSDRKTAILKIRTFQDTDDFDFKKRIEEAFSRIRAARIENLILDLRDNPGGLDTYGAYLYSLLTDRPFRYVERRDLGAGFRRVVWNSSDRPLVLMELVIPKSRNENGSYTLLDDIDGVQKPHPSAFRGELYVLANGTTFSTASNVATVIKHYRRGRIIGEETGSGYKEDSGGTFDVTLPNSGLIAELPIIRYKLVNDAANIPLRGVLPDTPVTPQLDDILDRRDSLLDAALTLIASDR